MSEVAERFREAIPRKSLHAVIGLPDQRWGETIPTIVVEWDNRASPSRSTATSPPPWLARYKLPTRHETIDALLRNSAGKVLKYRLREQFGG